VGAGPPVGAYRHGPSSAPQQSAQDRAVASNTAQASPGLITHFTPVGQVSRQAIRASRNSPGASLTILQLRAPDRRLKMMLDEGEHPMKRLLALAFVGAALATPAAAQSVPRTHRPPGYQTQDRVHVYGADVPQPRFRETRPNPDFQLGNSEE
jgi:hypothetical protein